MSLQCDPEVPLRTCGKYHLIAQLGVGGMAEVYLGVGRGPAGFNKLLVLKLPRPHLLAEPEVLAMFLDEARVAARLNHPNIVQTNEIGEDDGKFFIAMEYLEGQPLKRLIRELYPVRLPVSAVLRIIVEACAGLHYAHTSKDFDGSPLSVVHRDVSPHNVFITYGGQVKIVDFGIAKAANRTAQTQIGIMKGKIAYVSPEQLRGQDVDCRSDIFSLGLVLYESLTGQRAWGEHIPELQLLRRLSEGDIPSSPRLIVPDLPEEVDLICRRALAPNPEDRYASALEMQEALEGCMARLAEVTSARELGDIVDRLFQPERKVIAAIVEKQLRALDSALSGDAALFALPKINVGDPLSVTPSRRPVLLASDAEAGRSAPRKRRVLVAIASLFGVLLGSLFFAVLLAKFGGPARDGRAPSAMAAISPALSATAAVATEASRSRLEVHASEVATEGVAVAGDMAAPTPAVMPVDPRRRSAAPVSRGTSLVDRSGASPNAVQAATAFGPLDDRK